MGESWDGKQRRIIEVLDEDFVVDSGGHENDLEVGALCQGPSQGQQQKVGLDMISVEPGAIVRGLTSMVRSCTSSMMMCYRFRVSDIYRDQTEDIYRYLIERCPTAALARATLQHAQRNTIRHVRESRRFRRITLKPYRISYQRTVITNGSWRLSEFSGYSSGQ